MERSLPKLEIQYGWRLPIIGSHAQFFLKIFALALMLSDHIHLVFFHRQLEWLYWLSRLVFPIFALTVAQNLELHHANPKRYISRLVFYGVLAQPVYMICFQTTQINVLFTLASSIALHWILDALKARGLIWSLRWGLAIFLASSLPRLEFGWAGVLAVPVFVALMRRGAWWDWLFAFVLAFGIVKFTSPWLMPLIAIAFWISCSRFKEARVLNQPRWLRHAFYLFYPIHLALIVVFREIVH